MAGLKFWRRLVFVPQPRQHSRDFSLRQANMFENRYVYNKPCGYEWMLMGLLTINLMKFLQINSMAPMKSLSEASSAAVTPRCCVLVRFEEQSECRKIWMDAEKYCNLWLQNAIDGHIMAYHGWLVVSNMTGLSSISNIWDVIRNPLTNSYFSRCLKPPTSWHICYAARLSLRLAKCCGQVFGEVEQFFFGQIFAVGLVVLVIPNGVVQNWGYSKK